MTITVSGRLASVGAVAAGTSPRCAPPPANAAWVDGRTSSWHSPGPCEPGH